MTFTSVFMHRLAVTVFVVLLALMLPGNARGGDTDKILLAAADAERAIQYSAAESLYVDAISTLEAVADSPEKLIGAYQDLAAVRIRLCRFDQAQEAYDRALLLATTTLGAENVTVANVLSGLGRIEFIRGEYGKSERLFLRALAIGEETGGKEHPVVARTLVGLADVCRAGRRFNDGEDYARRGLLIRRNDPHTTPEDLAMAYVSLGFNLRGRGAYQAADQMYSTASSIAASAFGESHPICAYILNHQAALNSNLYQPDKAVINANRALSIAERLLGPTHMETGLAHANLARAYNLMGKYSESMDEYDKAIGILSIHWSQDHPLMGGLLSQYGFCLFHQERHVEAMELAAEQTAVLLTNYCENSAQLDDASASHFFTNTFYTFSAYPSSYFEVQSPTQAQSEKLAELVISTRGVAIDGAYVRHHVRSTGTDSRVASLNEQLSQLRASRSAMFFRDPLLAQQATAEIMDSLSLREKQLLSELAELGLAEMDVTVAPVVTLEEVCARIPKGACLVTYYGYLYVFRSKEYREEFRYAAMVLDQDGLRGHRLLGFHGGSDSIVKEYVELAGEHANSTNWSSEKAQKVNDLSARLRKGLWDPISDLVHKDEFVLLAPELGVSQLSFAGLIDDQGFYLAEKHAFHYLTAPRELLRFNDDKNVGAGMIAVYDPDYDASPKARLSSVAEDPEWGKSSRPADYAVRNIRPSCERLDSLTLTRLYNSRAEVDRILPRWETAHREAVLRYSGARANEEVVKHLAPGHRVLHLATHGFYVDDVCRGMGDGRGGWSEVASMYTGLLLAGANLNGRDADELGVEDGILTADEVSSLNLRGTDLVVLSACETGRGDLRYSSGAFSLSRAFRLAGARQVVSALWPVSDAASIGAMAKIYGSPEKTVAEALQGFAIEQINADRAAGRQTDPFTWAPYISYGDWRAR